LTAFPFVLPVKSRGSWHRDWSVDSTHKYVYFSASRTGCQLYGPLCI